MKPPFRSLVILALAMPGLGRGQAVPDAGQLLRDTQPAPTAPMDRRVEPMLTVPVLPPAAPGEGTVTVRQLVITGNTVFPTGELHALVADAEGRTFTLAGLRQLTDRITAAYRGRDYPLARAYLPAQKIEAGRVTIAIQEGRIGQIRLHNSSRLPDARAEAFFAGVPRGEVLTIDSLESSLLRLADTPGVAIASTLVPGDVPGTADLVVTATAAPVWGGRFTVDNHGVDTTGTIRAGGLLTLAGLFHHGGQLSLQGLGTVDSGQHLFYGRVGYDFLLDRRGTRLGAAYSQLDYGLGQNYAVLDASGTAQIGTVTLSTPLVRRRVLTVEATATYDYKSIRDEIAVAGISNHRRLQAGGVGVSASRRDDWAGGGVTSASVQLGGTNVDFADAQAAATDAAGARTRGTRGRVNVSLERWQALRPGTNLRLAVSGQWATGNLDSTDQFSLGGPDRVRAYPSGEAAGDDGYLLSAELTQRLPLPAATGGWQAVAFYDAGALQFNHNPFVPGANTRHLGGAGVGLRWVRGEHWSARADAGWRLSGGPPTSSTDKGPRVWLSLSYRR